MKKSFSILLALLALPCLLRANGDPVISYSAGIRSSNPIPMKVSEVQVVREDLNIKMGLPYADVQRKIKETKHWFLLSTARKNRIYLYKAIMTPEEAERVRRLLNERCPQRKTGK